ncbi:hypothetical protein PF001_g26520 [Phytophthora fragariae]|uniref:Pyruvate kinase n=1 Tax=Phytophthora fragariae TaxID=53985 RepID=A0A6A4BL09_9STRA|nr:hypothetical protein PF001_g26520 [Phytophthora fragariae]
MASTRSPRAGKLTTSARCLAPVDVVSRSSRSSSRPRSWPRRTASWLPVEDDDPQGGPGRQAGGDGHADAVVDDHGSSPECTDGANAVLAGTKAVMLTRESANGDYPTQAVEVMFATCLQAETAIHYNDV